MTDSSTPNPQAEAEKLASQAETGAGRTPAKPMRGEDDPLGTGGAVRPPSSGKDASLSGSPTNDAQPGGGAAPAPQAE